MGEILLKYYQHVKDKNGLPGKIKLAELTKIPSTRASLAPDDDETISKFRSAIEQITGDTAPTF